VLDLSGSRVRYGNAACLPPGARPAVLAMPNSRMGFGRGARRPAPRRACAVPGPALCVCGRASLCHREQGWSAARPVVAPDAVVCTTVRVAFAEPLEA
jgi:hypothetical protein